MADDNRSQLYIHLIGQFVTVRVQSGTLYTGVFHGVKDTPTGSDFTLRMARDAEDVLMLPIPEKVIQWSDFVELSAVHVETHLRNSGFQIDSEISGAELQERELMAWDAGESTNDDLSLLSSLDGDMGDDWDQFEVNKSKFGVKTTYQEEMYTTKLDKDSPFYKERIQQATKLAMAIEKEERSGLILSGDDIDEEALYSSVIREGESIENTGNRYVIPSRRSHEEAASMQQPMGGKIASLVSTGSRNNSPSRRVSQQKSVEALGVDTTAPTVSAFSEKRPEKQTEIEKFKQFSDNIEKKKNTPTNSPKQERKPQKISDSADTTAKKGLDANAKEFTPGAFRMYPTPVPTPIVVPGPVYAPGGAYPVAVPAYGPGYMAAPQVARGGRVMPAYRPAAPVAVPYGTVPVMPMVGMGPMVGMHLAEQPAEERPATEEKAPETKPATGLRASSTPFSPNSAVFVPGASSLWRGTTK